MYDENNGQDINNNLNPDENRREENIPNFIMQDPTVEQGGTIPQNACEPDNFRQQNDFQQQSNSRQSSSSGQSSNSGQSSSFQQQSNTYQQNNPYQPTNYEPRYNSSYIPPEPPKKKARKKHPIAGKVAAITAAALLFGMVAGGTMVGVNTLADSFKKRVYPQVSQAETQEEKNAGNVTTPTTGTDIPASTTVLTDVSGIVEKAMPTVVAINNTMIYQSNNFFGQTQTYEVPGSGSGIIVGQNDDELLIVTNNHVVADSNTLSVVFIDETAVSAAIKGTDSQSDLAVVAVPLKDIPADTLSKISVATLGESNDLKVGQGVIAIGNALGYGQSVTVGYVSALNREVKTDQDGSRSLLQTDAAINPGNSGGALLNMKGEVIGINAAKYSSTEVEGMGYAIPISKAQDIINSLMTKKTRTQAGEEKQGYLGIQGNTIDEATAQKFGMPTGVFVYKILENGAAGKSDLREKDIITKFDDQSVRTMADLQGMLKYYEKGETINLTVESLENGAYIERVVAITLAAQAVEQNQ